jgi:hypothetical protein
LGEIDSNERQMAGVTTAPDIQEEILFLTGEGPAEQSLQETSVRTLSAEVIWSRQREQWKKWCARPSDRQKKRVGAGGDC